LKLSVDPYFLVVKSTTVGCMSTGVVETLPETVYVATKKLGVHPREQIAVRKESTARQWLAEQIAKDRVFGEFYWQEYKKTVAESSEGEVYGHIQEIPTQA